MMTAVPLIVAAAFIPTSSSRRRRMVLVVAGIFLANAVLASHLLADKARTPVVPLAPPRGAGITIPEEDAPATIGAGNQGARPGEPIFSGATRHGQLLGTDVLRHFLRDRPAATLYYELNRGLMASETVQAEIIEALERRGVRTAVLVDWPSTERIAPSFLVGRGHGSRRLHPHRLQTRRPFGHYELSERL